MVLLNHEYINKYRRKYEYKNHEFGGGGSKSNSANAINIVLSADDNYAPHAGVTIASILKNADANDNLYIYILDGGISDKNKGLLQSLKSIKEFNLEFISVDISKFSQCLIAEGSHITIPSYFRLMMATLLPELDKVLYLDCDVIVNSGLSELYNTDINDYWMAGVEDLGYFYYRRQLGRETETLHVNTGVVLFNLKKWREDGIEQRLFDYANNNKDVIFLVDQDVLNFVLNSKTKALALEWNVQDSFFRNLDCERHPESKKFKAARKNPKIIHYTYKFKPWNDFGIKAAKYYYDYLKHTPWKDTLPTYDEIRVKKIKSVLKFVFRHPLCFLKPSFIKARYSSKRREMLKYTNEL